MDIHGAPGVLGGFVHGELSVLAGSQLTLTLRSLQIAHLYFVAKLATLYDGRPQSVLVASSFLFSCVSFGTFRFFRSSQLRGAYSLYRTGFGIVATYSSKHFDVSLFAFDLHSKLGWQLFASSLPAILAVSAATLSPPITC